MQRELTEMEKRELYGMIITGGYGKNHSSGFCVKQKHMLNALTGEADIFKNEDAFSIHLNPLNPRHRKYFDIFEMTSNSRWIGIKISDVEKINGYL